MYDNVFLFQSCKEQVDAVLFLFSFTDRTSFEDLQNQIANWTGPSLDRVVKLVVGTKYPFHGFSLSVVQQISKGSRSCMNCYDGTCISFTCCSRFDLFMHCDVAERDVRAFQTTCGLPVLRVGGEVSDGLGDVAPLLNCLAEHLWHQDCLRAGSADHPPDPETETFL